MLLAFLLTFGLTAGCGKKEGSSSTAGTAVSKGVNMQEGKWEITTTFEMPGMPAGAMKPQTHTACLSKKDYVPKDTQQQSDCTMKDSKINGDTVTWDVVCKSSSSKGSITYAGTTFDGVIETVMKQGDKETNAKMTMKGKHIGPCD